MVKQKAKPMVGPILRGQAWVELHGEFQVAQLRSLADEIERKCQGLEKKNDNQK